MKNLTSQDKLYLNKSINLSGNNMISMKKIFQYYMEYLKRENKIDKITQNGIIVNRIIKPFLKIFKNL